MSLFKKSSQKRGGCRIQRKTSKRKNKKEEIAGVKSAASLNHTYLTLKTKSICFDLTFFRSRRTYVQPSSEENAIFI